MPVLSNQRHELFAQELAKGKTADEAYQLAGYAENRGNASTLKAKQIISDRVTEILTSVAERAEVTIYDIADQLDEDRVFAKECRAASACVAATMGKAKVFGHLTDKTELTGKNGAPIEVMEIHEMAKLIAYQLSTAAEETAH